MRARKPEPTRRKASTIVIVDDHPLVRHGLSALINNETDLAVCGEATSGKAGLKVIAQSKPDLVIVDLALEGSDDGLDLVKEMKTHYPKIPVLVLSMHPESVYAERALRAGAKGYVTKQQLEGTVLAAIRRLLGGEMYMSDALAARLATRFVGGQTREPDSPLALLSDRELQVFRLLGQGQSTRQIAHILRLSVKTVESHREHLKQKLNLATSTELARYAILWVETGAGG